MDSGLMLAFIITGVTGLMVVVLAVVLMMGKGSFLIAGYNTMDKKEKEKYDTEALCKFIGKIILPIGILTPGIAFSIRFDWGWIPIAAYAVITFGLCIFSVVYLNTGNRFKK